MIPRRLASLGASSTNQGAGPNQVSYWERGLPLAPGGIMRILVVDADTAIREILAATIEIEHGCEVLTCGTLEEALELIDQVDAVLCDASFPVSRKRMSGDAFVVQPPAGLFDSWLAVWLATVKTGKRFVLLSGNQDTVEVALRLNVPAFLKALGPSQALSTLFQSSLS